MRCGMAEEWVMYVGYDCTKRCVLSLFFKLSLDFSVQILGCRLFQIFGPAELNDPSFARLVLHLAGCRLPLVEDLREWLWLAVGRRPTRYCEALPIFALMYQAGYLVRICSLTLSQCSLFIDVMTWSYFLRLLTTLQAIFWICWRWDRWQSGVPTDNELQ